MATTRERIDADIKEHVVPVIDQCIKVDAGLATEAVIHEVSDTLCGRLQNLATAGTQAGDAERTLADEAIQRKVAKKVVEHLKERYNLK